MRIPGFISRAKGQLLIDKQWNAGVAVLALSSGLMTLWKLQDVARSEYYAAIARSMSVNLGNLFFGAIDPAGTVTLDKIPGSYWIPAIFLRIFGFSTWAITAPNAIAAVALVVVVAMTAKMLFGRTAGILAGAIVATTPIVIAVSRSNQPQTFFLLTLSVAGYFAAKALMLNSRRNLIVSGIWIAVAFHTYMLLAWALWPALIIAWFFTQGTLKKKIFDLLIAGTTSLLLSLVWIITVALVPASHRPYIGGTYRNNPFEMVFGYNGLGRFTSTSSALSSSTDDPTFRSFTPPFGGNPGLGRIFSAAVAGQIAWLIPTAIVSIVILYLLKISKPLIIFYTLWFITFFAMFSAVSGIHQFYTSALALPIAILVAGAVALAVKEAKHWHIVVLLNIAGLSTLYIASLYSGYLKWVAYLQVAVVIIVVAAIFTESQKLRQYVIPVAVLAGVVLTPAAWSVDAHNHTNSINPIAGNESAGGMGSKGMGGGPDGPQGGRGNFPPANGARPDRNFGGGTMGGGSMGGGNFGEQDVSTTVNYLQANRNGAKFLLVTFGAQSAASYITATGENILPIGGFDGQDPTPTLKVFKKLVAAGEIRYVLTGGGMGHGNDSSNNEISAWVQTNCTIDANAPISNLYICGK